jgi:hypothetical protein
MNDFYNEKNRTLDKVRVNFAPNFDVIFANPTIDPLDPVHLWDKNWHAIRLRRL